ncbi:MAG TPA: hypothetical protein VIM69_14230 [Opitutaceae bacterium]
MKSLLKDLEQARARVAELELKAEQERRDLLASLPAKYGFASFEEFADAVRVAAGMKPIYMTELAAELEASKAETPYWREASEPEPVTTAFVAQGIQASRSAQAARPASEENASSSESATNGSVVTPTSATQSVSVQPAAEVAATPSATPAPPARPLPTGTSLSDPSNFGLLPDNSLFERGDKSEETFRMNLNTANIFAQQVLHTSRVPAAVWREWRDFARKAAELLRGSSVQVA